jgi:hypothetical protein
MDAASVRLTARARPAGIDPSGQLASTPQGLNSSLLWYEVRATNGQL